MEELPRILLKLLGVVVLVLLNGFFVAAEFALVKMRHTQLDLLIAKGTAGRESRARSFAIWTPPSGRPSWASQWRVWDWAY